VHFVNLFAECLRTFSSALPRLSPEKATTSTTGSWFSKTIFAYQLFNFIFMNCQQVFLKKIKICNY